MVKAKKQREETLHGFLHGESKSTSSILKQCIVCNKSIHPKLLQAHVQECAAQAPVLHPSKADCNATPSHTCENPKRSHGANGATIEHTGLCYICYEEDVQLAISFPCQCVKACLQCSLTVWRARSKKLRKCAFCRYAFALGRHCRLSAWRPLSRIGNTYCYCSL